MGVRTLFLWLGLSAGIVNRLLKWAALIGVLFCIGVLITILHRIKSRQVGYVLRGTAHRQMLLTTEEQMQFLNALNYYDNRTEGDAFSDVISAQLDPYFGVPSLEAGRHPRAGHFRITQETLNAMEFIGANSNLGVRIRIVEGGKWLLYRQLTRLLYNHLNQLLATTMRILDEMIREGYFDDWKSTLDGVDFVLLLHGPCSATHSHALAHGLPMFTFISSEFHADLLVPDPLQFGSHGTYVWPNVSLLVPWGQKKELALFRGKADCYNFHSNNWFSCTRVRAVKMSMMHRDVMDIGITKFNHLDWENTTIRLPERESPPCIEWSSTDNRRDRTANEYHSCSIYVVRRTISIQIYS